MIDIEATGKEIRRRMHEKKLNVSQLADKSIVSMATVYSWIEGRKLPKTESLIELARALDCKMEDIIKEK